MYTHPEHGHSIDDSEHEDCLELAEELLEDLKMKNYPEHVIELVEGIVGELEEYENDSEVEHDEDGNEMRDEEDLSDEELEEEARKEMRGEPHVKIKIKMEPK